ncbi:acyl-CoA dehydrogenase family protein [Pseudomonas resinovorans]|uniref:Acyl-CoA dehydrogenase family protein n=1 Tax=Metapseudomonas resinovorans TaxID=53412 RepID=A0ABT4Y3K4_METRE|nr:acyl-CoA dehydrogenase family protein [Pseudomonas resinovorans]MDA8483417.1 acyl-CoA dehydrogenase family protein [Pseudomonas resinovorans]
MDFDLTSEQQLLQDSVRRYVDKSYSFESRTALLKAGKNGSADNWGSFAANGWLMAGLPEAFGGLGGSVMETSIIAQQLGRALVLEPYLGCAVLAAQTLAACDNTAQKERLLPRLVEGSSRVALAYSEPGSRGMPETVALRAERSAEGFTLYGLKSLVMGADGADAFIVSARIAGTQGISLLLVDANSAGLERQALPLHDGTWVEELNFDGVEVGAEALLADAGKGLAVLQEGLAHGIVALCSGLIGSMERTLEVTADYLKVRKQFGVPIGSFQALQHRMADMAAEMEIARSMLHVALSSMANDTPPVRDKTLSSAKMLICRAAKLVCGQGIQLHGGIGMTEEYLVGHYFKHAMVADLLLGSSDSHEAACAAALQAELRA